MLTTDEIKERCKLVLSDSKKKNYNVVVKLLQAFGEPVIDAEGEVEHEPELRYLALSLAHVFVKLFERGHLVSVSGKGKEHEFADWCRKLYTSFKNKLLQCIAVPIESSLGLDCIDAYMRMLEQEAEHFASQPGAPFFPNKTLKKLVQALFESTHDADVDASTGQSTNALWLHFVDTYYKRYVDVQFYTQAELAGGLPDSPSVAAKWLALCNHDNHYDSEDADLEIFVPNPPGAMENEARFKSNFESNWLHVLSLASLTDAQYKTIFLILHKRITPHFQQPTRLMDFLTDSYDNGHGVIPLLALNGLFDLMRRHNLEYPNFYTKLYQLVTPDMMHTKYRSRFMRLIDLFLSSTHLPANLVASFIKRLARLSLDAPPAAIVSVIPFVYNLIKRHPSCMIMLHDPAFIADPFATQEQRERLDSAKRDYVDPFDSTEQNPEATRAIDSSLWELETLMSHYHPNVSTLAKIFSQPFQKLSYNMEDFLDWSYDSLLAAESTRKMKVLPSLEFDRFDTLFGGYIENIEW
ncbi:ADR171Cp [Eremothecium gossypii ATCC 10895]|uniref:ADR171Cp n=1 Tax=Eremothecium gossypii (strain ATCC 10895 / CBS 109.51 / FGSC 9923 / NRRL Y-1056) TaxID=284811 RepID=Q759V1_EREGS|nr:ADR171Cp [Eremothecium gossypii ATCC 10895]AAS52092.2 ADR171Cp [Eremothecium gossypii ATCC 10895]AEY96391.1 FADR171Cp [Eremothecium gossypii FDAG1]